MKAVILAAGRSTRLYPVTIDTPKCLLEIGGKTLLEHQLDALDSCGIEEVVVVTGYLKHLLENKIAEISNRYSFKFTTVENSNFAETNNIYSLWTAREFLKDSEFLVFHADVLFHPEILRTNLESKGDIVLITDRQILEETMKLKLDENERVTTVGKHVRIDEASGTFLGIALFSEEGGRLLLGEVNKLVAENETNAYFAMAIERLLAQNYEVQASFTDGLPWIEIDFPEELASAKNEVFPLIMKDKSLTSHS